MEEGTSIFSEKLLKNSYTPSEFIEEFTKPCGRFNSPLSLAERFELAFIKFATRSKIFTTFTAIPHHSVPPNWQILLNYLHRKGILEKPTFNVWPRRNDLPQYYHAHLASRLNKEDPSRVGKTVNPEGYGTSFTSLEEAYAKATGELLERYFLTVYNKKNSIRVSYEELVRQKRNTLPLHHLPTFLPWQKEKFKRFESNKDTEFHWLEGQNLTSQESAYIPVQLLYWGYNLVEYKEPFLRQTTTNGEAGGYTRKEAILSGLYENIERDGFLIYWLNTLSPQILDIETFKNEEVGNCLTLLKQYGLEVYFLDTTTDLDIPSCICAIVDNRTGVPVISVGGSAGFNAEKNIISSLKEATNGQNSREVKTPEMNIGDNYEPFSDHTVGRVARAGMWQGNIMYERFAFFISGKKVAFEQSSFAKNSKIFPSVEEEYLHALDIFRNKGAAYDVYCYEAQHPILTTLGYHVVKIIIPALMSLYLNEHLATLDSVRLREVPAKLGYTDTKLNPWPHPLP